MEAQASLEPDMLDTSGAHLGSFSAPVEIPLPQPLSPPVPRLPLPTDSFFREALVDVLARLTDYQANVGVEVQMDTVIIPVLKAVGIDPDTHPQVLAGHWPLVSKDRKDLKRKVEHAQRNQREGKYASAARARTVQLAPMVWGLNPAGVEDALQRRREAESNKSWKPAHERNLTEEWFSKSGRAFSEKLTQLVLVLSLEDQRHLVETRLVEMVESDGLHDLLEKGGSPSPRKFLGTVVDIPETPPMPKPSSMFDALLRVLCKRAGYQAGLGIDPKMIYTEVLRKSGIDPKTHPHVLSGHWLIKGSVSSKLTLHRQVQHAMKCRADTRVWTCPACKTKNEDSVTTCESCAAELPFRYPKNGLLTRLVPAPGGSKLKWWAMTEAGVARVIAMECSNPAELTTHWLRTRSHMLSTFPALVKEQFRRLSNDRIANLLAQFVQQLRASNRYGQQITAGTPPSNSEVLEAAITFIQETAFTPNATAVWFGVHAERKINCIRTRLTAQLSKSRNIGEIDDLVNDYITNAIRLNSITKWQESHPDQRVTDRMVANWALKRAYSKFRDAAKDCHQREFRDARSKNERDLYAAVGEDSQREGALAKQHEDAARHSEATTHTPVHLTTGADGKRDLFAGSVSNAPLVDAVDVHSISEEQILHKIDRERGFAMLEDAIRRQKPGAPERYVGIFRAVYEDDKTTKEIATIEQVQRNRAASLTQDMRSAIRASLADSEQVKSILGYVAEEPFSTETDLHTDLGLDLGVILKLVGWMSESGWLERRFDEARGHAESSYLVTTRGQAALRESNDPDLRDSLLSRVLV